ncbi:hypothetical protein ACFL2Q_13120 [Thermodesulfobacteriota bacterium]
MENLVGRAAQAAERRHPGKTEEMTRHCETGGEVKRFREITHATETEP